MLINNKNINTFGSSLVKYEVGSAELNKKVEWVGSSLSPYIAFEPNRFKDIKATVLIEGSSREAVETNKSNLAKELKKCVVKFADSKYIYDCVLESVSFENINRLAISAEINLKGLTQEPKKEIILAKNTTQSVTIEGNAPCEVVYEVVASVTTAEFIINGITVKNIPSGQTLLIDGVKKRILLNGQNKIKDTEFWEFPKLNPGANTINMNLATMSKVSIHYNPCWI